MSRKSLLLFAALFALVMLLFATFLVGQHIAQRTAEQASKREQIEELDGQLKRLARVRQGQSIVRERARIAKIRDKLQQELSEASVPPFF